MTRDELSGLADLLDRVSLEDEAACIAGEWRERVRPVTRPFLKRVMDRVERALNEQWLEDGLELKERKASKTLKKAHFAYRVFDDVMLFLHEAKSSPVFEGFGDPPLDAAFDAVVRAKVLPKFHGARARLEIPLLKVVRWCQSDGGTEGAEDIERQVRQWQSNPDQLRQKREAWTQEVRHPAGPSPNFRYPRTAAKVLRMLVDLDTIGFAAFA